uniref:Uncharacterized protein n=1 Tax=Lotharella oceanica TaxID=641309 RepID=A0A7S2TM78_9EUKA|mmetsp:Transcript_20728/g.38978  ORF Transcript_20728/g.38978 Transcript_20728/m.38978 type:complete len:142 (+) Transcript_20728:276-701(+)
MCFLWCRVCFVSRQACTSKQSDGRKAWARPGRQKGKHGTSKAAGWLARSGEAPNCHMHVVGRICRHAKLVNTLGARLRMRSSAGPPKPNDYTCVRVRIALACVAAAVGHDEEPLSAGVTMRAISIHFSIDTMKNHAACVEI